MSDSQSESDRSRSLGLRPGYRGGDKIDVRNKLKAGKCKPCKETN